MMRDTILARATNWLQRSTAFATYRPPQMELRDVLPGVFHNTVEAPHVPLVYQCGEG